MNQPPVRVGVLATHPIQYYAPWYRALAARMDLDVFFSHRQTASEQAAAGFGVAFDWDVPLLDGYRSRFLTNVARSPAVDRFRGCNTPEIGRIIEAGNFNAFIVHGWSTFSYWQAMSACWRTRTPVLVRGDSTLTTPRSWWRAAIKVPIYRWFIPRFDGYLVVGRRAREYVLHYGADPARCFDAPHCVDNTFFASRSDELRDNRTAIRARFGIPQHAVAFLFAGRFIQRKRPATFVRAVAAAAGQAPAVFGLMVGDGPIRGEAEALASEAGAPIRFSGFLNQTDMVAAYAACDALIVPSEWETWGLVVNEAMACGLPAIVTSGVACADDLVIPSVTGEVCAVDAVDQLAAQIVRLAGDGAYRATLAVNARRRVDAWSVGAAVDGTVNALNCVARRSATDARRTARDLTVHSEIP
jgi:glycosyltransferase involved in cell wall biosynthesis